ncbi:MAG: hypothetical protein P8Y45_04670 [Exilibacterium sp.]
MAAIRSLTTWLALMVFSAASSSGIASPQPDPQTVVYTLDTSASQLLRTEDIAAKAGQIHQWQEARQQLQRYLHLAQQYSSSRYAGFGIEMYKNIAESYRRHPHVQLVYADLLQYSHDFDSAVLHLEQLAQSASIRTQVQLRLFTIHLIQGDLAGAQQACSALSEEGSLVIPLICKSWLAGLTGSASKSVALLSRLMSTLPADSRFKNWAQDALIDLHLKNGDTEKAMAIFEDNFPGPDADKNSAQQYAGDFATGKMLVDCLIFAARYNQAARILHILPKRDPFIIRQTIVNAARAQNAGPANTNLALQAQQLIDFYKVSEDPSHYYDIALWYAFKVNDPPQAWKYAQLNWERFKYITDLQLMKKIAPSVNKRVPPSTLNLVSR